MAVEIMVCGRQEYDANLSDRLIEEHLGIGGLFTAIFAIQQSTLALKFPIRIAGLAQPLNGVVEFVALDKDLRPATKVIVANMGNGIISDRYKMDPIGHTEQGYFMGYENEFDIDLELSDLRDVPYLV